MPGTRIALIVLQVVGGLSILPYPFILLANVMSIAAPKQTLWGAMPFLLLSLYPILWLGLYVCSWWAIRTGGIGLAFALSSIPLLACFAGVGVYALSERSVTASYSKAAADARSQVEPINPLLWKILCSGGQNRLPGAPDVSVADALKAIDGNPTLVNVAVPPYGTPLKTALLNLSGVHVDGRFEGDGRRQRESITVVRSLVAHGARLEPEERNNLWRSWQLRRAMFDGPIDTANENPLVWRIITRPTNTTDPLGLRPEERALLNRPTRLHGSPMYATLLTGGYYIFPELAKAGARLTPEEQMDPAAAKALAEMLQRLPEMERVYDRRPPGF